MRIPFTNSSTAASRSRGSDGERMLPPFDPMRYVFGTIVLLVLAYALYSVVTNERFQWPAVARYFFAQEILAGVWMTIVLSIVSMVIGLVVGLIACMAAMSGYLALELPARIFVWLFRGTPILVQIIFWYNVSALFPSVGIRLPFGPTVGITNVNELMTPAVTIIVALSLYTGAYMSEIFRGGIIAVDSGQFDASNALGMSRWTMYWQVILPQAFRIIIPPTGNEFVTLMKTTSLASVIGTFELLYTAQVIYHRTFETIPLLVVVALWYLILTTAISYGQKLVEQRLSRSVIRVG